MDKGLKRLGVLLLLMICSCWIITGNMVSASEEAPVLEYLYINEDQESGAGSQMVIVSFQTGGRELSGAVLKYQKENQEEGRIAATEVVNGYAAFLIENTVIEKSQMTEFLIGCDGRKYAIDIQEFYTASDTLQKDVKADERIEESVDKVVAESTGDISKALRSAEGEAGSALATSGSRATRGLNLGVERNKAANIVVVLDPGHGGYESGAVRTWDGITYTEKDIVLKISRYTKRELEKYEGVRVYMTRNRDVDMTLEDRVNYAASVNATVLISQHINSTPQHQSTATGAEVMVSSGNYRPNQATETANIARTILAELEKAGFKNRDLVYKLSETGTTYPNGRLADYYGIVRRSVLAGFPGMIVEHGFVSNPEDCIKYYGSNAKIKRLGVADATAIAKYYGLKKKNFSGWNQEGNGWYYINADGERASGGWLTVGGKKYYLDSKGYRVTGWKKIKSRKYYFNKSGVMYSGILRYAKRLYYLAPKGHQKTGFFLAVDGQYRYASSRGVLYTGWKTYRGNQYYFDPSTGAALTGWQKIGRYHYYFSVTGKMRTGMVKVNGRQYFFRNSGRRAAGIVNYKNKKYYFDRKTGIMVQSKWVRYKKKWYFFSKKGPAYQSTKKRIHGKKYRFNKKGVCTNKK